MSESPSTTSSASKPQAKKRPLVDLLVSIVIPSIILSKYSSEEHLGPVNGLIAALSFPILYFIYELILERRTNLISILGIVSVVLTGGIGLLALPPHWVAVKEAAIPAIIGLVVLASLKTKFPLVRKMVYNDNLINTAKVAEHLAARGESQAFERLLVSTSYLLAGSFFLSSFLNYVLAKVIVVTDPAVNQVAFNEELGQMTALSYPVIVLPSTAMLGVTLWLLIKGIKRLTGLTLEEVFNHPIQEESTQTKK